MQKNSKDFITQLQKRLDTTIRPGDDFFGHVNNKWLEDNPIPPSESRWGTFYLLRDESWKRLNTICEALVTQQLETGSIQQKVRDFYLTGINKDKFKENHEKRLRAELALITAISNAQELASYLGYAHQHDLDMAWNLQVDADDKDSTIYVIRIVQDGLTLPDRDYYLDNSEKMQQVRREYITHITRLQKLVPELPQDENFGERLLSFETELARASMSSVEQRDIEKNYNPIDATELEKAYPNIAWSSYYEALTWQPSDKVIVNQLEFMKLVNKIFVDENINAWKEYLAWRLVVSLIGTVSEAHTEANFEFFGKVLSGKKELQPLWRRTIMALDTLLGFAAGALYCAEYFPETTKHKVEAIVEDVRDAFARRIGSLQWMSDESKSYALKKLRNMTVLIGYSDDKRDYTTFDIAPDSYLHNFLATSRAETLFNLHRVGTRPRRDELHMTPQTVNAYHDPNQLVIAFPAGILQWPFYDDTAPDFMNFAGIGAVTGHELTHGFDDQGSQFDADGNVRDWLNSTDHEAFNTEAQKLSALADKFEVLPGIFLKGGLVLGEAIADLGGLEIALDAYRAHVNRELTDEEIRQFYQAFATCECHATTDELTVQFALSDPHPNERFRVNGIVQHCENFYASYAVEQHDKLFLLPEARVRIW